MRIAQHALTGASCSGADAQDMPEKSRYGGTAMDRRTFLKRQKVPYEDYDRLQRKECLKFGEEILAKS